MAKSKDTQTMPKEIQAYERQVHTLFQSIYRKPAPEQDAYLLEYVLKNEMPCFQYQLICYAIAQFEANVIQYQNCWDEPQVVKTYAFYLIANNLVKDGELFNFVKIAALNAYKKKRQTLENKDEAIKLEETIKFLTGKAIKTLLNYAKYPGSILINITISTCCFSFEKLLPNDLSIQYAVGLIKNEILYENNIASERLYKTRLHLAKLLIDEKATTNQFVNNLNLIKQLLGDEAFCKYDLRFLLKIKTQSTKQQKAKTRLINELQKLGLGDALSGIRKKNHQDKLKPEGKKLFGFWPNKREIRYRTTAKQEECIPLMKK